MAYELWRRGTIKKPSDFFSMSYLDKEMLHIFVEQENKNKAEEMQNMLDSISKTDEDKRHDYAIRLMLFKITGSLS